MMNYPYLSTAENTWNFIENYGEEGLFFFKRHCFTSQANEEGKTEKFLICTEQNLLRVFSFAVWDRSFLEIKNVIESGFPCSSMNNICHLNTYSRLVFMAIE